MKKYNVTYTIYHTVEADSLEEAAQFAEEDFAENDWTYDNMEIEHE